MNRNIIIFFILSVFLLCETVGQETNSIPRNIPGIIVFKVKTEYKSKCKNSSVDVKELHKLTNAIPELVIRKKFPLHGTPKKTHNKSGHKFADLSLIYSLELPENISSSKIIAQLNSSKEIEYAELLPIHELLNNPYEPEDSKIDNQYFLKTIQAFEAWGYYKGDTNVVIGIVDTGTDIKHSDLIDNIKYNYDDPIDSIDNDNDGYIDNFMGWDMGSDSWNPHFNYAGHGVHVCGVAAASTDNYTGVAGVGFKCKFLPVKIDEYKEIYKRALLTKGYEGIVYAADHGCKVINCSWGSRYNSRGKFGQDIITYASINRDALVVASCGNDDNSTNFYPASYDYVLSVAASTSSDLKWIDSANGSGSNYGIYVDVSAPGEQLYSTYPNNSYGYATATSTASPLVAGVAGYLRGAFPTLSALQIGEKIRVTSDNIDTIGYNTAYKNMLGLGRVNMYNAYMNNNIPAVRITSYDITDNNNNFFSSGDTLVLKTNFLNYLYTTSNLTVTLQCDNPLVTIIDSVFNGGTIAMMENKDNYNNPFSLIIADTNLVNQNIIFKFIYNDNNYFDYQYIETTIYPNYLTIDTNNITLTIVGNGRSGYANQARTFGISMQYKEQSNLLSIGGLVLGRSSVHVSDNIYGDTDDPWEEDFSILQNISQNTTDTISDYDTYSIFSDEYATPYKIGVDIIQKSFAWANDSNSNFIILEYSIINTSSSEISGLYAGYYADWDINDEIRNRAGFDEDNILAYVFPIDGGTYAGIKLLNATNYNHYAVDHNGDNGSINTWDGFKEYEKFEMLNPENNRNSAGISSEGNDVSHMLSTGPLLISPGDTSTIAFAMLAGIHLYDLQKSAIEAADKYGSINQKTNITSQNKNLSPSIFVYPNPFSKQLILDIELINKDYVQVEIFNIAGKKIKTAFKGQLPSGSNRITTDGSELNNGIYYYQIKSNSFLSNHKIIHIK